jgi:hypothetical protein
MKKDIFISLLKRPEQFGRTGLPEILASRYLRKSQRHPSYTMRRITHGVKLPIVYLGYDIAYAGHLRQACLASDTPWTSRSCAGLSAKEVIHA